MGARSTALAWAIGSRLPHWARNVICSAGGWVIGTWSPAGVPAWEANVERLTGRPPTRAQRRELVGNWLRNNLMSLSLARWSDPDVLERASIPEADVAKLHTSLSETGLVLALPHMGSWDFAGAWCARIGIKVVSVAERLPDGLFEVFTEARAGMGMDIHPVDHPQLMTVLADDVRAGSMVCLLSDRDLSGHGIPTDFGGVTAHVPAGPALLARRTGADLRTVAIHFDGDRVQMAVSDPVPRGPVRDMMQSVVDDFVDSARRHPTSWLMMRQVR